MNKKLILSLGMVALALAGFTSCKNKKHDHTYDGYSHDENQHWQVCTVNGCSEEKGREDHHGGTATETEKAKCEVCNESYGSFAAHEHAYTVQKADAAYLVSEATCESPATYYKSCACGVAGTTTFTSGNAIGHTYGEYVTDATHHWKECTVDGCEGATEKEAHSGGTATTTEKAKCEKCSTAYGELAPATHSHTYEEVVEATYLASPATCTEAATYYKSCTCGDKSTETFTSGEALGHDYGTEIAEVPATETTDGTLAHYECSRCEKLYVKEGETYVEVSASDLVIEATGTPGSEEPGEPGDPEEPGEPTPAETKTYYFVPGTAWSEASRYAVYVWNTDADATWLDMTDTDGDGVYEVELPVDTYANIIFCGMKENTVNAWGNEKYQTVDLVVGEHNKVTLGNADSEGKYSGSWSTEVHHEHTYTPVDATPSTCTTPGTIEHYTCDCGKKFVEVSTDVYEEVTSIEAELDADNHEGEVEYDGTGKETHTPICSSCGEPTGEAVDHVWEEGVCTVCDRICIHEGGTATEDTEKVCDYCGTSYGGTLGHTHNWVENVDDKYLASPATCIAKATYYKSCSCGEVNTESTFDHGEKLDTHTPAEDWINDEEEGHYYVCTVEGCDAKVEFAEHEMTTELVHNSANTKHYYECTVCGYQKDVAVHAEGTSTLTTIYLVPNENWQSASARFAIYLVGKTADQTWIDLTKDTDGSYYVIVDSSTFDKFIFVRLNPATSANNWNDGVKWNQTNDLVLSGNNCYTITGDSWSYGTGTWSTKHNHCFVLVEKEATCTETGLNSHYECACGELFVKDGNSYKETTLDKVTIKEKGHDYDAVVTAPTCTEVGYTTYTCKVAGCGHTYTGNEVAALGHKKETVAGTAPTCTTTGLTDGEKCSVCGTTTLEQEEIKALGHTAGTAVVENKHDATCTVDGSYDSVVYCTVESCKAEISRETITIKAEGHDYETKTTAPDCENVGYTTYTCACGDKYTDNEVQALGHTAGTPTTENLVPKTCTVDGSYDLVTRCTACNKVLNSEHCTITATGHDYATVVTSPTCTEGGYTTYTCKVVGCGDTYTDNEVAALGHTEGTAVVENEHDATCTVDGSYDSVVYCTVESCKVEIGRETITVPATGHSLGNYVDTDENYHWKECSNCDYHTTKLPHVGGTATTTEQAICKDCGRPYGGLAHGHEYTILNYDEEYHWLECSGEDCHERTEITPHTLVNPHLENRKEVLYTVSTCECGYEKLEVVESTTITVTNESDLRAVLSAGRTAVLDNDIDLSGPVVVTTTAIVDLNGYTITTTKDTDGDGAFYVTNGTLTINDSSEEKTGTSTGTINSVGPNDYSMAIFVRGEKAKVIINGGTYTNVGATDKDGTSRFDLIYVKEGGTVEIYGGTFHSEEPQFTLNHRDDAPGTIIVHGGKFYEFNPSKPNTGVNDNTVLGDNVCSKVEGKYFVVSAHEYNIENHDDVEHWLECVCKAKDTDSVDEHDLVNPHLENRKEVLYTVSTCECGYEKLEVVESTTITVTNESDLRAVLSAGRTAVLDNDIDLSGPVVVTTTAIVDLNGYTITTTKDTDGDGAFYVTNGTLTINDSSEEKTGTSTGTINSVGPNDYSMAIFVRGEKAKVIINGGTYTNVGATDKDGTSRFDLIYVKEGGTVEIYGGTFHSEEPQFTLNHRDDAPGTIIVHGGKFYEFNPSKPNTGVNDNTVLGDGLCAQQNSEKFYVVAEHSYSDVVKAPTCTEQGYTTYTCSRCNDSYVDSYVDATGHSHTPTVTAPTCTEGGYTTYTCACGDTYTGNEVPATGHNYSETEYSWADDYSTLTATRECINSECTYSETVTATVVATKTQNQSCTDDELYTYVGTFSDDCKWAETQTVENEVTANKLGHTEGTAVEENKHDATCTVDGSYDSVVYCTVESCKAEISRETITIIAEGHALSDLYNDVEKGNHYQECSNCDYVEESDHTGNTLTYNEENANDGHFYVCECGYEFETEAHVYGDPIHDTDNTKHWTECECGHTTPEQVHDSVCSLTTLYFVIHNDWLQSKAQIYLYTFGKTADQKWTKLTNVKDNLYVVIIDSNSFEGLILVRINGDEGSWDNSWNQSEDIKTITGNKWTMSSAWGTDANGKKAIGAWSTDSTLHTHCFVSVSKASTCTETGLSTHYACACGALIKQDGFLGKEVTKQELVIPANGHKYTPVTTAPTCTEGGYTTYTCACGYSYVDDRVAARGHDYNVVLTAPTCTEAGYTTYTCKVAGCGYTYTGNEVEALGHSMITGEDERAVAPTCTEAGLTAGSHCTKCDHKVAQQVIPAKGHDYTDAKWHLNATEHWKTCNNGCGEKIEEGKHNVAEEATENLEAYCSICEHRYGDKANHKHVDPTEDNTTKQVDATCTTPGTKAYYTCTCGKLIQKDGEWVKVNEDEELIIPTISHTPQTIPAVAPTCTEAGSTAGKKCKVCGTIIETPETINANGHTEDVIPAVAPTCTEAGLTAGKKCSVCNVVTLAQQTEIPTGHAYTPGQSSPATCGNSGVIEHFICGNEGCGDIFVKVNDEYVTTTENNIIAPATGEHTGGTATSKVQAVCTVCNQSYGDLLNAVYYYNSEGWTTINAYHWDAEKNNNKWPGQSDIVKPATDLGDKWYYVELDKSIVGLIFNNGTSQTNDISVSTTIKYYYGTASTAYSTANEAVQAYENEKNQQKRVIYVNVCKTWVNAVNNPRFCAVFTNSSFSSNCLYWVDLVHVSGSTYKVEIPNDSNITRVQFQRMNVNDYGRDVYGWDYKWNSSSTITIDANKNLVTMSDGWDGSSGTWSTYNA